MAQLPAGQLSFRPISFFPDSAVKAALGPEKKESGVEPPHSKGAGPLRLFFVADETAQFALSPDRWPTVRGRPMTCYLVRYEYFLVFAARDPRPDGCLEPVEPGVWLDDGHLSD